MKISAKGVQLIKHFEAYYDEAYQCAAGVWTIGWGTTVYMTGNEVKQGQKCTRESAQTWLDFDLDLCAMKVGDLLGDIVLNQAQFDALVSFAYNCGVGALAKSSLLRRIIANPDDPQIIGNDTLKYQKFGQNGSFLMWSKVDKQYNKGLIRRRKAEAWLYVTGELRFFESMLDDQITPLEMYVRSTNKI